MTPLVIGSIGIVFGDIGTSTLYTFSEAFGEKHGMPVTTFNVLGVLSLVLWTLGIVVALKYLTFIMRADNKGEGGIMAMMALAQSATSKTPRLRQLVAVAAVLGAALFFGDSVITPSITVLSSIEGLEVAAPSLSHWVVWIAVGVLIGLFMIQKRGTGKVGILFGPVMCIWFVAQGLVGVSNIIQHPMVLRAFSPWYGINFFIHHGTGGFLVLGAVVLCVTGAEALYADMGHFGRRAITIAAYGFVIPGVMLNYLGQGALLIHDHSAAANPFFHAVPDWALYPMIGLATAAAVIASQSVITGAFSIMRQAVRLGFLPRMPIVHTSKKEIGQIYMPWINRILMVLVLAVVIGFGSSNALAGAYGIAVTGAMAIDALLFSVVAWRLWKWHPALVILLGGFFLTIDLSFFGANTLKVLDGGWFPLVLGGAVFILMLTWRRGRKLLMKGVTDGKAPSLKGFVGNVRDRPLTRVSGTAVFLAAVKDHVPYSLLHNLKHNKVLHERNVVVTVETMDTPIADAEDYIDIRSVGENFYLLTLRFGFMEKQDIPRALKECGRRGLKFDMMETTFFASRWMVDENRPKMMAWQNRLFGFMFNNTLPATAFFNIPANRLVVLGFR